MEKVPDRNARALELDPPSDGKDLRGKVVARALLAAFVLLTMIVYGRNLPQEFAGWDLGAYRAVLDATDPVAMTGGLFMDFKGRIVPGYYAPISSVSLMLDKYLVGSTVAEPSVTAFVNLVFHCINGCLLFLLLSALGADVAFCSIAAFFFLLHPVQVAGVIWFAQRKTVLGAMFCLLSWLSFLRYRDAGSRLHYGLSLLTFELAVLAKPTYVFFPVILVASQVMLPRDRGLGEAENSSGHFRGWIARLRCEPALLVALVPFFILSAGSALLAMGTEPTDTIDLPWVKRPFILASALWFYAAKIVAPVNLTVVYPLWHVDLSSWRWWVPLAGLLGVTGLLIVFRRRLGDRFFWALAVFLIPVLPASGIFKFGHQLHSFVANHFLYFSMIGAGCLMALLAHRVATVSPPLFRHALLVAGIVYLALLVVQTEARTRVWNSTATLWNDNLRQNPGSLTARLVLGRLNLDRGKLPEAEDYFLSALEVDSRNAIAFNNLGLIRKMQGRTAEAEELYRKALASNPSLSEAANNLGRLVEGSGRFEEAVSLYRRALEEKPDVPPILLNLANVLVRANRITEAIEVYRNVIRIGAGSPDVHNNLGVLYMMSGQPDNGIRHFRAALRLDPRLDDARANLEHALKEVSGRPGSPSVNQP